MVIIVTELERFFSIDKLMIFQAFQLLKRICLRHPPLSTAERPFLRDWQNRRRIIGDEIYGRKENLTSRFIITSIPLICRWSRLEDILKADGLCKYSSRKTDGNRSTISK